MQESAHGARRRTGNRCLRIVREGKRDGASVMKGFAGDSNIAPYIDDIYAYLQARADGALGRGRPTRIGQ